MQGINLRQLLLMMDDPTQHNSRETSPFSQGYLALDVRCINDMLERLKALLPNKICTYNPCYELTDQDRKLTWYI